MSVTNSLENVDPRLVSFFNDLKKELPSVYVFESNRSFKRQVKLYWACVNGTGSCPAAPPGQSAHQYGRALDINGFSSSKDRKKIESVLVKHPEIEWGVDWKKSDPPHFQIRNWRKGLSIKTQIVEGGNWIWLVIAILILYLIAR
ncbi:M15 family metallopeptidase [Leptospira stimsonii]|uniref:Peptidase M15 n=1 Tax=Leptospira stimsonii TaxID=2202203 RepID=A0ABY2MV03_9LEPT|nr:M15 family metallopeptidase [Leptospira stimsonii]TGK25373.1 peptidase M15 [Leptospira stimsonii]TGM08792.1 peptidase M15 [Leptospira stimsonii]